ncbi:MAG: hypothetical protein JXR10_13930 [Cyclobacteriaceae bacterium]
MDSNQSPRAFVYLLLLFGFISLFFIFDRVFGFEYNVHEINQAAREHAEELAQQEAEAEMNAEEPSTEEGISDEDNTEEEPNNMEASAPDNEAEADADAGFFDQMMDRYKNDVVLSLEKGKARTDVIVRYYRHAPDGNSAYALEELGYYIHERPVDPRYADFQSNAIYYGDSVTLEDIQIVGYTLMKEGLPIKIIKPSKFGDSWKARSIEIGTDTTLVDEPTLSLDALQGFVK